MKRFLGALFALLVVVSTSRTASAHKPSDAYVTLNVVGETIEGRWDIALRDADYVLGLDANGDGNVTWGEVRARQSELGAWALSRLSVGADGEPCVLALDPKGHAVANHSDGAYAVFRFTTKCARRPERNVDVRYSLLFDVDPQHRGVVRFGNGTDARMIPLSVREPAHTFALESTNGAHSFGAIVREGILHIWTGYDHVLFLIALLLPAVLSRTASGWKPASSFRVTLADVLRVVTAFTIAHSITLSLAALEVVVLPSRLVESVIAASIVVAALNNLYPVMRSDRWTAAFALGLMHGFGFSATLVDVGLTHGNLAVPLFGFNLGVEIGQLAIVAAFLALAYHLRTRRAYVRVALVGGSVAILAMATIWFVERAFVVSILT